MKKTILTFLTAFIFSISFAQNWELDKSHANVGFTIGYMKISDLDGNFGKFEAKITSSKEDFSDAVFDFSAESASINTGIERRDNHLKAADYFDAEKFPSITFLSTSVKKVSGQNYKITGNLTLKGVTKLVTFDAVIKGPIEGRNNKKVIGVTVTGKINRVDFGVGRSGGSTDDEVVIRVSGPFSK